MADLDGIAQEEAIVFHDIKEFLEQNASSALAHPVEGDTPLLDSALDSFTVLQLMIFLSEKYAFELQADDFVEEHFGTVSTLAKRIVAKRRMS